jgi:hypothetical protein
MRQQARVAVLLQLTVPCLGCMCACVHAPHCLPAGALYH